MLANALLSDNIFVCIAVTACVKPPDEELLNASILLLKLSVSSLFNLRLILLANALLSNNIFDCKPLTAWVKASDELFDTTIILFESEAVSALFNLIAFKLSTPFCRHALVANILEVSNLISPFVLAVAPFTLNTSLPEVSAKFLSLSVDNLAKFNLKLFNPGFKIT